MTNSANVPTVGPTAPQMSDAVRLMQYDAAKKSAGVAYLLWFFLGYFGVHRFYLGQTGSGVAMAIIFVLSVVTTLIGIGLIGLAVIGIWWFVDAFLIPGIATRMNQELATRLGAD